MSRKKKGDFLSGLHPFDQMAFELEHGQLDDVKKLRLKQHEISA